MTQASLECAYCGREQVNLSEIKSKSQGSTQFIKTSLVLKDFSNKKTADEERTQSLEN